ncbi:MAG: folate-binding protein YgfZ [Actinomycetaceae bacterium]|nr:folate-binding protein YgfZ [Actinomycetaceae bacterium]
MTVQSFNNQLFGSLPGAVIPEGQRTAAHYGNPFGEERKLRNGTAFVDLSDLDVVAFTGADRAKLLHNLSTRDFENLAPGASTEMLVLDPNGRIEHAGGAIDDGQTTWIITDVGRGEGLAQFFQKMRFMMRVEAEVRRDLAVVGVMCTPEQLPAETRELARVIWEDPWPQTLPGGATYGPVDAEHPASGSHRTLLVIERASGPQLAKAFKSAGFTPAGMLAWEAARIVDRRPRPNTEIDERSLPHELDWLRTAVHLDKGCYRGQETVAKLVNLGRPPRRLTYLYLEGADDELPPAGTEVMFKGRPAGKITSAARSVDEGPVALALLKLSLPIAAVVDVGSFIATQEEIVSVGGKSSASPAHRPGAELRGRGLDPRAGRK